MLLITHRGSSLIGDTSRSCAKNSEEREDLKVFRICVRKRSKS